MNIEELVRGIVEFCSTNGSGEGSIWLGEKPHHVVATFELLDYLVEQTGISKEQIGKWFDTKQRELGNL